MFEKQYYTLVAGLREYSPDTESKGFDAPSVIGEIKDGVSPRDRNMVELFYAWYDIGNIIALRGGQRRFSALGNFTQEELQEELASPHRIPQWMSRIVAAYDTAEKDGTSVSDEDDIDLDKRLENNLFAAYYAECGKSRSKFLREWSRFDLALRNVSAALASRRRGVPASGAVVGEDDVAAVLSRSSAPDFGLKGEVDYIDRVMAATEQGGDLMAKERTIDEIRWEMADELAALNYFDIDFLLGYLAKINIIHRWATLDPQRGGEMLKRLLNGLTGSEVLGRMPEA